MHDARQNAMMLLHPLFLYGLAGVSVPILIHLLARRRARRMLFPSLRLLKAAEKKRRRLARLRRPLSLLLRCLAIALLALGLAAPVVGPVPGWLPLPRPQALAIVIDDSLSMSGWQEGASPFSRAGQTAEALMSGLGAADRVALVPSSSPHETSWSGPAEAREALRRRRPTATSARLSPALAVAAELLKQANAPNQHLVLLTDFQATAWREPPVNGQELGLPGAFVVDVGTTEGRNLSVDELDLLTAAPLVGRPTRLSATAAASFPGKPDGEAEEVVLQMRLADEPVAASEQEVSPQAPAAAQFSLLPETPDDTVVGVVLSGAPYGIAVDDARYRTVRARPSLRVLIATPSGTGAGPGRYLATALNPFGDPAKAGMSPELRTPDELAAAIERKPADVVVLANCPRLDRESEKALRRHVESGGGVLIFLGDDIDATYYGKGLLPRLTGAGELDFGRVLEAEPDAPFFLSEISTSREPLNAFASPRAGDLGALRFAKMRHLEPAPATDSLARFDNGEPAVLQWGVERARVVLLNTSADGSWGEHIREPAYVPLLHVLCAYVARQARPVIMDVEVGERPAITGAEVPGQVALVDPRGDRQSVTVEDGLLPEVKEPGAYHVTWDKHKISFAANVERAESDLTRTDTASVRRALAPAEVEILPWESAAEALKASQPLRADLSWPLLLLALAILLFESVFSIVRREPVTDAGSRLPAAGPP
jgi:hypothetical protein